MKKFALAAALLAATAFSGSAFALSADSAKGLQVSSDAVKVAAIGPSVIAIVAICCATRVYVVRGCGCSTWGWGRILVLAILEKVMGSRKSKWIRGVKAADLI